MKKKIVVFTGAGVSKESGIDTFRDSKDGMWMKYDIDVVASKKGWEMNESVVTEFYNARRKQLKDVFPNDAHKALAKLEEQYDVTIITQNVDNLHERGGSTNIIHLHGELNKVRCQANEDMIIPWENDVTENDKCKCHNLTLRPHIVWFGEMVDTLPAEQAFKAADIVIVCGTSFNIGYTISLVRSCSKTTEIHYIDPNPVDWIYHLDVFKNVIYYKEEATTGMQKVLDKLMENK